MKIINLTILILIILFNCSCGSGDSEPASALDTPTPDCEPGYPANQTNESSSIELDSTSNSHELVQSFAVDCNNGALDQITFTFECANCAGPQTATMVISLFRSGSPGSLYNELDQQTIDTITTKATFTLSYSGIVLSENPTYWLHLNATNKRVRVYTSGTTDAYSDGELQQYDGGTSTWSASGSHKDAYFVVSFR